jgi:hypothetical protein
MGSVRMTRDVGERFGDDEIGTCLDRRGVSGLADRDGQFDLAIFEGASAGLLDESDLKEASSVIEPGSSAGVLIFENRWATPFIQALRGGGAELVAAGYIPQDSIAAALDATDH